MKLAKEPGLSVFLLVVMCLAIGGCLEVSLSHVSTLYLPTYADTGKVSYGLDTMTLEQMTFDPQSKLIYAIGRGIIHIVDATNTSRLHIVDHVVKRELDLTDVEVCGQAVFISYVNQSDRLHGGVLVYRTYELSTGQFEVLHDLKLGSLPDMVYPTKDCTLLVALENEGVVIDGHFYDPPGGVAIIRFPSGVEASPSVKILDFTKFDNQFDRLSQSGVRWVYRANNSFSNNIEPEYITFNHNYTKAFVCLQENNAIAVVDLTTDTITDLYGLGFKPWGQLDPSDKDGGIHLGEWPIYGMYLPDSIHWVHWNGEDYIVTANEGDSQDYGGDANFDETIRGHHFRDSELASTMREELKQALSRDTQLGRLLFSKLDGRNADGKVERLYTYGARSFSLFRASDMSLVYDSGSDFANFTQQFRPNLFNSDMVVDSVVSKMMDTRSDNKGVEPESVTTGELAGHLLVFVGLERPGAIAVYSAAPSGGLKMQFQQLYMDGIPEAREGDTYQQIYNDRQLFLIDPEYIQYLSPSDGLADFPALLVGGTVSGTISVLRVDVQHTAATCTVCKDAQCDVTAPVMTCPSHQPLCVTSVTTKPGSMHVTRRCADEAMCNNLYLNHTLSKAECAMLNSTGMLPEGHTCHFCCYGDNCNAAPSLVPDSESLYKLPLIG